jgi:hypothetical protein
MLAYEICLLLLSASGAEGLCTAGCVCLTNDLMILQRALPHIVCRFGEAASVSIFHPWSSVSSNTESVPVKLGRNGGVHYIAISHGLNVQLSHAMSQSESKAMLRLPARHPASAQVPCITRRPGLQSHPTLYTSDIAMRQAHPLIHVIQSCAYTPPSQGKPLLNEEWPQRPHDLDDYLQPHFTRKYKI